ncbi:gene transfer agent family protein [Paracoccus sp. TK19116]|uniref:Gene transfer agent family protein n=1 Tax=Paracoccus albicereus TaxID=2922394 RepID=A0ABT1MUB6_9RHOB|nr:gene transfer agent family protein [Paracoccus albicereus]MCQ0971882.1 gene transfer agent family protein [Paracoccus albicereus]
MANPQSGEVSVVIDGRAQTAKLTLGALAEMEASLGDDSLLAMVERFESGQFRSRDVLAVLVAGLRGGGWRGDTGDLLNADIGGGPLGAARSAAELLARAFRFA